ncbi:hypothetical protein E0Z10_g7199 [Xylaria hypoxylon]|uniref:Uncharacterized protein n=1 Tax=Xylaria hypoxylon TaxID=37992 RepID=A0A4Z0YVR3_9PEZI|nr:hypothetical protein E0Z10_g7199 [Xylaria hypoxylon]
MATPVISGTTRTNLGPLTTNTWTYTCTEVIQQCSSCGVGWAAQTCIKGVVTDNQECWPPRATNVPATTDALLGWGVYSPGIVCPGGYTSAAAGTHGGSYNFDFDYPLTAGETAMGCCPIGGFSPIQDPRGIQTCVQFKPTTSFLVGSCGTDGPAFTPFSVGGTLDSTQYNSFSVSAPFLQVVYQASDLPATSTNSSSTSSTSTPTTQPSGQTSEISKSSGLSTGATAGIAVGVVLGAIFIATAAFCIWRTRRRRGATVLPQQDAEFVHSGYKPFGPVGSAPGYNNFGMGAVPPGVVPVNPNYPAELANPVPPAELGPSYR